MLAEHSAFWTHEPFTLFRPLLKLAVAAAIFETMLIATLFSVANMPYDTLNDRYVLYFLISLALYVIMVREFKKRLHIFFEDWIAKTRLKVMDRVRQTDLLSLEQMGTDVIVIVLTYDVKSVSELSYTIASTAYAFFLLLGILLYLALLSEYAFLITVIVGGIAGAAYLYNQRVIRQLVEKERGQETDMFEAVRHLLHGFKELRLNDRKSDEFFHQAMKPALARLKDLKLTIARRFLDNYSLTYGFWKILIIAPLLLLPLTGVYSHNTLLTFLGIILTLPINYLVDEMPRIMLAGISIQRLRQVEQQLAALNTEPDDTPEPSELLVPKRIRYQKIMFHYESQDGRPFSVGPVSFTLHAGEIVFITGGNGSGKTTLLKLLTGLYHPDAGQVFVNDVEVQLRHYRDMFAVVFADIYLFDRLYGLEDVDEMRVEELLETMLLTGKVRFHAGQFAPLELSTGQRKRLALVVALLEDAPIYVFDEWAADQDPHFREYFYLDLLPWLKSQGKAVLAITHDDRYFDVADRIVKMDEGQFFTI